MELFEKVASIIRKNKGVQFEISPEDRLREDLGLDSFDTLMIGCDLEDEFNISIDPDEMTGLKVVQDIVDKLEVKIAGSQPVKI